MASTNVDYYQKQKDLLDSMHDNEGRRSNLEAQLQAYFQSDQKLAKLRAVKLQSYWKKVCDDEKRSKQRNSQLMRDLDRIEANMAGLEARREKIRHMKEQYFDYIEQTYPQWLELVNKKRQEDQQKFEPQTEIKQQQQQTFQQQQQVYQQQQQQAYQQQQQSQYQQEQQQQAYQQQQQEVVLQQQQQQNEQQQRALQEQQQRRQQAVEEEQQREYESQQTYKKQQEYFFEKQQQQQNHAVDEDVEGEEFIYDIPPPLPSQPPPPMAFNGDNEFQDREYTNIKNVRRQPQATTPSQIVTVHVPSVDREEAGSPAKLRPDSGHRDPANQNWVPADKDTSVQSLSVSDMDPEPAFSQPIKSVTVRQISDPPKVMEPQSDDDLSDFGDDVDLPSGDGPLPSAVKQEVHVALIHGDGDSQRDDSPVQKAEEEEEDRGPVVVHPELSTPGLFNLLKYVEAEIGNALSVESYYRCRNPDPSTRKEIIHKGNNKMDLKTTDGEFVSMVILEQLTPVVRRLPGACILSDTLLVRNTNTLNEALIRNNLHRDALEIWEKLLDHFMCLVKNHVMGTRELATVFVPCLVHQSSQHKDKTVSILETIVESAFERKEGMTSPVRQDSLDTARSSQQDGVPPLKFGSLVDSKAFTDEESSMITQSMNTEGSKLPLNETEAYKNLLSGSLPISRPQVQADDTDTNSDNELEKQYMSTFTPRSHASKRPTDPPNDIHSSVPPPHDESPDQSADHEPPSEIGYVPTAPGQSTVKSGLGSTGGSSQQRRLADKLGMNSDLDSDTELDIENMVTKKEEDDDDFYDFYG